eukprot:1030770-Prymnesium_polylepis.1
MSSSTKNQACNCVTAKRIENWLGSDATLDLEGSNATLKEAILILTEIANGEQNLKRFLMT